MRFFLGWLQQALERSVANRHGVQRGLTLVEVLIVVAIMGVLLASALPAYEAFLIRGKVAEGLGLSEPYKDMVAQNALAGRALNAGAPMLSGSDVVRTIIVADDGVITLSFKPEVFGPGRAARFSSGATVTLIPLVNGSPLLKGLSRGGSPAQSLTTKAVVEWSCATESSTLMFGPRGTLPTQFAPPDCR